MTLRSSAAALAVIAGLVGASGCAASRDRPQTGVPGERPTRIQLDVGPCFGFCPVYFATFDADGTVRFDGVRHTAELGERLRRISPKAFEALARDLQAFRPADPGEREGCDSRISDQQHVTVTWRTVPGAGWSREHDRGCLSSEHDMLDGALERALVRSGIAGWALQVSRPGVPRG